MKIDLADPGELAFQYRERVPLFAAPLTVIQNGGEVMFQYRERVTPFAADNSLTSRYLET